MRQSIRYLRNAAIDFVNEFSEGRDRLGLVVFGASAIVAFPPHDPAYADASLGPDSRFKTAHPSIADLIASIQAGSNTGTAEALTLAYSELAANPVPDALNTIVLFTDGLPNGIAAEFNDPDPRRNLLRRDSGCTYRLVPNASMRGVISQQCAFRVVCSRRTGVTGIRRQMSSYADGQHASVMSLLQDGSLEPLLETPATKGCAFPSTGQIGEDIREIPSVDLYGNLTTGDDYRDSVLYRKERVAMNLSVVDSPYQIGLASWNAADSAAKRIRQDANLDIVIHVVGLGFGSEPIDTVLLERIANVRNPENRVYNPERPSGLCEIVDSPQNLSGAFQELAREIQRARTR
jgi:hypothetical protein